MVKYLVECGSIPQRDARLVLLARRYARGLDANEQAKLNALRHCRSISESSTAADHDWFNRPVPATE